MFHLRLTDHKIRHNTEEGGRNNSHWYQITKDFGKEVDGHPVEATAGFMYEDGTFLDEELDSRQVAENHVHGDEEDSTDPVADTCLQIVVHLIENDADDSGEEYGDESLED